MPTLRRVTMPTLCATVLACLLSLGDATAQEQPLTLDRALALARAQAPRILAARGRIEEARGRLAGASRWLRDNPVLEAALGPRDAPGGRFTEAELALTQTFELGGARRARMDAARAGVAGAAADADDATRLLLRDVGLTFLSALHAAERRGLAESFASLAADTLHAAERRHAAGDLSRLDLNLARAALARARADVMAAEAAEAAALAELRLLLGLPADEPAAVAGSLADRSRFERAAVEARAAERADVRALRAELAQAEAEIRQGRAQAWPELGLGLRYEHEERADVVQGAILLSLPLFDNGRGLRAEARARAARLRLELDAALRAVQVEVAAALAIYRRRAAAAERLERDALPLLDENEALARNAFEAGELELALLLFQRREAHDTRVAVLDRLLETAAAGIEMEASLGILP